MLSQNQNLRAAVRSSFIGWSRLAQRLRRRPSFSPVGPRRPKAETQLSTPERPLPTSPTQAIRAKAELEFCAADYRAVLTP
ncbi:hypothetical protein R6Z07F_020439 [Ovis aries]